MLVISSTFQFFIEWEESNFRTLEFFVLLFRCVLCLWCGATMPLVGKRKKRSVGSKSESQTVHEKRTTGSSSSSGSSANSRVSPELQVSPSNPPSLEASSTSPVASSHGADLHRQGAAVVVPSTSPVEVVESCDTTYVVSVSIGSDSAEGPSAHKACVTPESNSGQKRSSPKTRRSGSGSSGPKKRASRNSESAASPSSPTSDRVLRSATRGLKLDPSSLGVTKRSCSSASPEKWVKQTLIGIQILSQEVAEVALFSVRLPGLYLIFSVYRAFGLLGMLKEVVLLIKEKDWAVSDSRIEKSQGRDIFVYKEVVSCTLHNYTYIITRSIFVHDSVRFPQGLRFGWFKLTLSPDVLPDDFNDAFGQSQTRNLSVGRWLL